MLPFALVLVLGVTYLAARAAPGIGLHGRSLVLSIALVGFVVGVLGIRQTMLLRQTSARVHVPLLALLLVSSALLVWVQPTGPGVGGCVVAISIAIAAGLIPARLGVAFIVAAILLTAFLVTENGRHQTYRPAPGFLGSVFSFAGLFLYAMLIWRFRQNDLHSQRLLVQVEETHDAELRAAALAERQRLARDMHDVLAHSLSGLVLQLEGARLLALSNPGDERLAGTIDRAHQLAKSGLEEARQAIGMLRDDELPGPAKLAVLARAFEADTGIPCAYAAEGEPRELGSAARLAVYRVAQEALTNIRKHASPDRVDVRLEYLSGEITLAVQDYAANPSRPSAPSSTALTGHREHLDGGYGLAGMRERAELLGGTLAAGPTDGGFLVLLRVPT
jgi:signal transduction histidine kinase